MFQSEYELPSVSGWEVILDVCSVAFTALQQWLFPVFSCILNEKSLHIENSAAFGI